MSDVTKLWNFSDPKQAREYLDTLSVPGKGKVTMIKLDGGRELHFKDMTDDEAIIYAAELAEMFGAKRLR